MVTDAISALGCPASLSVCASCLDVALLAVSGMGEVCSKSTVDRCWSVATRCNAMGEESLRQAVRWFTSRACIAITPS